MATSVFEVARNRSTRYIRNVAADCLVSGAVFDPDLRAIHQRDVD